jgi:hypothetical protein
MLGVGGAGPDTYIWQGKGIKDGGRERKEIYAGRLYQWNIKYKMRNFKIFMI